MPLNWSQDDKSALVLKYKSITESFLYVLDIQTKHLTPINPSNDAISYHYAKYDFHFLPKKRSEKERKGAYKSIMESYHYAKLTRPSPPPPLSLLLISSCQVRPNAWKQRNFLNMRSKLRFCDSQILRFSHPSIPTPFVQKCSWYVYPFLLSFPSFSLPSQLSPIRLR